MNPDRQQAIDYLRAPANGLWRWTEDGTVLEWRDGSTIAFREEIAHILEWLSPNGLPSFGAIVFLLAACRGKVPAVSDIIIESDAALPPGLGTDAAVLLAARQQLKLQLEAALTQLRKVAQLESALRQMRKISQLPGELNSGLKARCVLAEAVFEPARAERHVEARSVLLGMCEPMGDRDLGSTEIPSSSGNSVRQIHIIAEGLKPHSAESLALRLRTGLDTLPEEIDAHLPVSERARRLIEELSRDRELGAVARAARELTAAIRLPRRLGEREQLAVGGVADITNRGPLDRLLLSELAHDDLTLAVRVALNEALYLRREPPMREPPGTLAILLDSGVRLWGIPRVLATAVALALVARDKQHQKVLTWRAHGQRLAPVNLLSRNGLTQHLGELETAAHVGESLSAFEAAVAPGAQNQSVVITHRDALDDASFRRALAEHPAAPGFVAAVDRDGHFELHALPLARRPPLCEANLDLGSIFADKAGVSPIKTEIDPNLPAIFGVRPFPFLLPIAGRLDYWITADGWTFGIHNDRRLVQFRDASAGARILANDLPGSRTLWMGYDVGTLHVVKAGTKHRAVRLYSVSFPDALVRVTDLVTGPEVRAVHGCGEVILVIRDLDVRAHALSDGQLIGRALNPHRWVRGRYFRGQDHFYFVAWDGVNVKFEPVTMPNSYNPSVIAGIFDREGMEGPWLVHQDGLLLSTIGAQEQQRLPLPPDRRYGLDDLRISRDGHTLYTLVATDVGCILDIRNGQIRRSRRIRGAHIELDPPPPLPRWNLFHALESMAPLPDGLAICGRKNRWRKIRLSDVGTLSIEQFPAAEGARLNNQSFESYVRITANGFAIQKAQWPNGSKAFLDSRGLLHLKSHDPTIPEVSLVLSHGEVAGWTSDGLLCGPEFFFEDAMRSEPTKVFERLRSFLQRL